jgi:hypothetical protein
MQFIAPWSSQSGALRWSDGIAAILDLSAISGVVVTGDRFRLHIATIIGDDQ